MERQSGVVAWHVSPNSPGANAGLRAGDQVLAINDAPVHASIDVTKRLWRVGLWSIAHYRIQRAGKEFEAQLVIQPAARPSSIENYLTCRRPSLSVHRTFYLCAAMECHARRPFLHFLPGFFRPVFIPVHGQADPVRLGNLLGGNRGQASAAGVAAAFRAGISGAASGFQRTRGDPRSDLRSSRNSAAGANPCRASRIGIHAVDRGAEYAGPAGSCLPGNLLPAGRALFS